MRFARRLWPLLVLAFVVGACRGDGGSAALPSPSDLSGEFLIDWNEGLTSVLVTDIVSPPVASRMYVYPNIAAYEALAALHPGFRSLTGQIAGLDEVPRPEGPVHPEIAAGVAFSQVAQALVFDGSPLAEREAEMLDRAGSTHGSTVVDASIKFGIRVSEAIRAYAQTDRYAETRTMEGYGLDTDDPSRWHPTPPDYQEALEPNWNKLRPFTLASAEEFAPERPTPFDSSETSAFHYEVMEVYEAVVEADFEQVEIAKFWDCNPLVSTHIGHVMTFDKKITPGGHWIGIAGIAARKSGADAMRTAEAFTLTAIALADAFISCWDEKYRSDLVRPETVINRYIDPDWRPILQTPAFPEYTSGHSVVSGAASEVLTKLFGEPFPFDDSTEVEFGLPVRSFESFRHAGDEAALSRLYGGIHYRPAIENGVAQGRALGSAVVKRIATRVAPD